ncbi:hypothetical protein IMSAGC013_01739 [Lachnospiraceae bacterium]|nr:hypothetical protein IMSAGC013_01739 [Lachnospiraceae bacterium]
MPPDAKSKEMLAVYWLRIKLPDCPFTTKQGNPAVPVCKKRDPSGAETKNLPPKTQNFPKKTVEKFPLLKYDKSSRFSPMHVA